MVDKKEEILNATFQLFSEKGYHASMADIARQVGIKVPSIYSHYESKDEIIILVMTREINNYFVNLHKEINELEEGYIQDKLNKIYVSILRYFDTPERIRFWKNISLIHHIELRNKCRDLVREYEIETANLITKIFEEGVRKGEIKEEESDGEILLYMAMIQGILDAKLMYCDSSMDMENFTQKIWQAYWNGIKV